MLNVAVSRAKKSFLVFGDMDIFDQSKGALPSSLLAKYLFKDDQNEITDIIQPKYQRLNLDNIEQITSLARHRQVLRLSFSQAQKELNIISPFLRESAIEEDEILSLIQQYSPNIAINIYTDPTLNRNIAREFSKITAALIAAGANVFLAHNVHSKILTIDQSIIVEGSFNWLSACRRANNPYQREESSILYTGKNVAQFIHDVLEPVKMRIR